MPRQAPSAKLTAAGSATACAAGRVMYSAAVPTGAALMSVRYLVRLYRYLFAFDPATMTVGHIPEHERAGVGVTLPQTD